MSFTLPSEFLDLSRWCYLCFLFTNCFRMWGTLMLQCPAGASLHFNLIQLSADCQLCDWSWRIVFPLESKKRTYTYILAWNFGHSPLLMAITPNKFGHFWRYFWTWNVCLGVNGNPVIMHNWNNYIKFWCRLAHWIEPTYFATFPSALGWCP